MKLVTFKNKNGQQRAGWLTADSGVVDMKMAHADLPSDTLSFIQGHEEYFKLIADHDLESIGSHYSLSEVTLMAPLPNPPSIRDFIGFEQHMLNASKQFGHTIGEVYYDIPVFYFTNHQAVYGTGEKIPKPSKETKLDLELEIAVVIGKKGHDIQEANADDHIFGYTVFNDWTARAIQGQEMQMPLGPAKGKDFANAFGPCIVTKDEFEKYRCSLAESDFPEHLRKPKVDPNTADRFNVKMEARINGTTVCEGNYNTVHWTFSQMINRASRNCVNLYPGDILGSGTVGWGCLVENGFSVHRPLESGDVVELEIEGIGILRNSVK